MKKIEIYNNKIPFIESFFYNLWFKMRNKKIIKRNRTNSLYIYEKN